MKARFADTSRLACFVLVSLTFVPSSLISCHGHADSPLLLLISFDGFRWDYLKQNNLSNFEWLKHHGSSADFIYSTFSTVTSPNHWTLVTGLYQESHGILQNEMFDPKLKKLFSVASSDSQTLDWYGQNPNVEPIWTTNQRSDPNRRRSAAEWFGADIQFGNQTITSIPYNESTPYLELVDRFVGLFVEKSPINFGALYFDEPDRTGHIFGPNSSEVRTKLLELDAVVGHLIAKLNESHLIDKLNLIITSDHGMEASPLNNSIFLADFVNTDLFEAHGANTIKHLFLKNQSNKDLVYSSLKRINNLRVFTKEEFPDELHYKNNVRFGDLVILADQKYSIYLNREVPASFLYNGSHGYLNNQSSMNAIFLAHGPAFRRNYRVENFHNVDIYALMCTLLEIEPQPNNGSMHILQNMLVMPKRLIIIYSLISVTPIISAAITALALYIINKRNRLPGQHMLNDGYMILSTSEMALKMDEVDSTSLQEIAVNS